MGLKVAKFGGSSVADALQINKIKNIIVNNGSGTFEVRLPLLV